MTSIFTGDFLFELYTISSYRFKLHNTTIKSELLITGPALKARLLMALLAFILLQT